MQTAQNQIAQGDVYFIRREAIPEGYTPAPPGDGRYVCAHSETGHHHTVNAADAILYEGSNPLIAYLRLGDVERADIVHQRDYHTHETVGLTGGPGAVWEVRRQREYTSEGLRRAQD